MGGDDNLRRGGIIGCWAAFLLLFGAYLSGYDVALNVLIATAFVAAVSTAMFFTFR